MDQLKAADIKLTYRSVKQINQQSKRIITRHQTTLMYYHYLHNTVLITTYTHCVCPVTYLSSEHVYI